eukprot:365357-Lingulodinium_polyedra.AAC.1
MKGQGWSEEAISGLSLTQPTFHLDASHRDIAIGRESCLMHIRKNCERHFMDFHGTAMDHSVSTHVGAGPPPPEFDVA